MGNRYPLYTQLTALVTSQALWGGRGPDKMSVLWHRKDKQAKIKVNRSKEVGGETRIEE